MFLNPFVTAYLSRTILRDWRRKSPDVCCDCSANAAHALAAFTTTLEIDPKCKRACYQIGVLYKDMEHYREAIDAFTQYLSLDNKSDDAKLVRRYIKEMQK